jgi:uncharacterized protein (TIGR00255 family)
MIKSMTGYGYGRHSDEALVVEVEAKSINHRYCDVSIRLPKELTHLEHGVRKLIQNRFSRGHFDIWIKVKWLNHNQKQLRLDSRLAEAYLNGLRQLKERLQLPGEIGIGFLGNNPHLFTTLEEVGPPTDVFPQLEQALCQALDSLEQMRAEEGRVIYGELNKLVDQIKHSLVQIKQRSPQLVSHYQARLAQRIKQLAPQLEINEERLAQEVVLYAERADIDEELVRLDSHLNQLSGFLAADGALGKKLDFLVQEMNRETNTIGSKASDVAISQQVVEIRCRLEKIREQVQNIE